MSTPDLRAIFESLERPCDKFAHYFPLYELHFARFVGARPRILEVGTQFGGSAEMWRKYFGEGTSIVGVDIEPRSEDTDYMRLVQGDQGSVEFWHSQFAGQDASFDIVIDDGSHDNPHQITTLLQTWRLLKEGGVYWCEDTHTSYYHDARVRDGGYRHPRSFVEFAKNLADVVNAEHTRNAIGVGPIGGPRVPALLVSQFPGVRGVHFYDSIVVIDKDKPLAFERLIHPGRRP